MAGGVMAASEPGKVVAFNKILWAISPFPEERECHERTAQVLRAFAAQINLEIQPVYVLSPDPLLARAMEYFSDWRGNYAFAAKESLKAFLESSQIPFVGAPEILVQPKPSLKRSVEALLDFAKSFQADLIVTGTQGKRGLERWVLGSFAETVLVHSELPVLTVNPHVGEVGQLDKILFPSDLGHQSGRFFDITVALAKALGATINILHKYEPDLLPVHTTAHELERMLHKDIEHRRNTAKGWIDKIKHQGVSVSFLFDDSVCSVVDSILSYAKKGSARLIAMDAHTSHIPTTLLSRVTREVIREAPCPVLTLRTG